ncbi:MAG: L,D-transpeptidase family protein [Fuerstiella sp.]
MDPFAYQKPRTRDKRKLALMIVAIASFSVWHFDLMPALDPVATGNLDFDINDPSMGDAEFMAMLQSPAMSTEPTASDTLQSGFDITEPNIAENAPADSEQDDPLLSAIAAQSEPMDNAFPEFTNMNTVQTASVQKVQQVAFEKAQPPEINFEKPPVVLPADVASHLREVDLWIDAGETLEAHAALSRIYWKKPEFRPYIQDRLQLTAAEIYANPTAHFAEPRMVEFGETLQGIAKEYDVPWQYLANLNSVTPKTLQAGRKLKVLKGPFGAVVDLNRFELTIHAHGWYVHHYRIGIGQDKRTPVGEFTVQNKLQNPVWHNPAGGMVDADDPTNPLGEYWLGLGDHIGIHGTIDPSTIGRAASRGCIHMADGDIDEVFQLLGEGSTVVIRN